jgi:hypothetical protein
MLDGGGEASRHVPAAPARPPRPSASGDAGHSAAWPYGRTGASITIGATPPTPPGTIGRDRRTPAGPAGHGGRPSIEPVPLGAEPATSRLSGDGGPPTGASTAGGLIPQEPPGAVSPQRPAPASPLGGSGRPTGGPERRIAESTTTRGGGDGNHPCSALPFPLPAKEPVRRPPAADAAWKGGDGAPAPSAACRSHRATPPASTRCRRCGGSGTPPALPIPVLVRACSSCSSCACPLAIASCHCACCFVLGITNATNREKGPDDASARPDALPMRADAFAEEEEGTSRSDSSLCVFRMFKL